MKFMISNIFENMNLGFFKKIEFRGELQKWAEKLLDKPAMAAMLVGSPTGLKTAKDALNQQANTQTLTDTLFELIYKLNNDKISSTRFPGFPGINGLRAFIKDKMIWELQHVEPFPFKYIPSNALSFSLLKEKMNEILTHQIDVEYQKLKENPSDKKKDQAEIILEKLYVFENSESLRGIIKDNIKTYLEEKAKNPEALFKYPGSKFELEEFPFYMLAAYLPSSKPQAQPISSPAATGLFSEDKATDLKDVEPPKSKQP